MCTGPDRHASNRSRCSVSETLQVSCYRDLAVYINARSACLCSLLSKYTCYKYVYHNYDKVYTYVLIYCTTYIATIWLKHMSYILSLRNEVGELNTMVLPNVCSIHVLVISVCISAAQIWSTKLN